KTDVIVAISGDAGPRTETAVRLWKQGYAPRLMFSGASLDPNSVSSAELMKRDAMRLGVPSEAILAVPASTTTAENAKRTAPRIAALRARLHARRAVLPESPRGRSRVGRGPLVDARAGTYAHAGRAREARREHRLREWIAANISSRARDGRRRCPVGRRGQR